MAAVLVTLIANLLDDMQQRARQTVDKTRASVKIKVT